MCSIPTRHGRLGIVKYVKERKEAINNFEMCVCAQRCWMVLCWSVKPIWWLLRAIWPNSGRMKSWRIARLYRSSSSRRNFSTRRSLLALFCFVVVNVITLFHEYVLVLHFLRISAIFLEFSISTFLFLHLFYYIVVGIIHSPRSEYLK